jgi:hypothetical protein
MRLLADRHDKLVNSESIFFGLSDASPIGHFFYQISEYFCIGGTGGKQELVEFATATCHLRSFSKRPEDITGEDLSVMDRLMRVIRSGKRLHAFAPMCMESKNATGEVRSICFLQQARLENHSWEMVRDMMAVFFSFTLDRGTRSRSE